MGRQLLPAVNSPAQRQPPDTQRQSIAAGR